ncbi:MAG: terminase family protein [Mycobacterium sp.]|nr:terminase family protein [Mycobacterium sp.]
MGRRILPGYRITPAVALISDVLAAAITGTDRRVIISVPPRESKSTTVAVLGTLWALARDHDESVILASYADSLAIEHSRTARDLAEGNADLLGIRLSRDKTSTARWTLEGSRGGLLAVGIGSSVTGFGCGLLVVDDAVKNAAEADSPAARRRILNEFRATLLTRVHPGGSVVLIGTRWAPDDLLGALMTEEPDKWEVVNIPAVAAEGVPDALGRPAGVSMTSAMGRTKQQFEDLRRSVGERTWHSLYQGVPAAPEGALIRKDWLDTHRRAAAPAHPIRTVVAVDPADSGERDAAGIIAASLGSDGVVNLIADATAKLTSEEWAKAAIALALDVGASAIHVEAFASGTTYVRIVREALARMGGVAQHITVSAWPPKGKTRRGDAVTRAQPLLQAMEVGGFRLAGSFPEFEAAALRWQVGQHCPDSVAAAVIAHDVLAPISAQAVTFAAPDLTRRIGDRPGLTTGQPLVTGAAHRTLSRSLRPGGYDPTSYPTRTIRVR